MQGTDEGALDYALNRAIDAWYNDRAWFHGLQKRVMEQVRSGRTGRRAERRVRVLLRQGFWCMVQ